MGGHRPPQQAIWGEYSPHYAYGETTRGYQDYGENIHANVHYEEFVKMMMAKWAVMLLGLLSLSCSVPEREHCSKTLA